MKIVISITTMHYNSTVSDVTALCTIARSSVNTNFKPNNSLKMPKTNDYDEVPMRNED